MSDFATARKNMVDCQIYTAGVSVPAILQAFETVPREKFVPKAYQEVSYLSEDLSIGGDRFILEPQTHAKMLEAIEPSTDNMVLDIGMTNGYSAAILSSLVSTVVSVEPQKKYMDHAVQTLNDIGACNVVAFKGALNKGWKAQAPYDLIFMNGAVVEIPKELVKQLAPGGRLITIVKSAGKQMGSVTLVRRNDDGDGVSSRVLFEAGCPYLPGFEPQPEFKF